jgi:ferredoxin
MRYILQKKTGAKMIPMVDLGQCNRCEGCIEIAPEVFRYNRETGCIQVIDLSEYPADLVEEAIKNCPEDCIFWDE